MVVKQCPYILVAWNGNSLSLGKKPDICFKLCKLRVVHFFFEAGVSLVTSNISAHMGNRVNFYYFEVKPKRAILLKTQKKKKKAKWSHIS